MSEKVTIDRWAFDTLVQLAYCGVADGAGSEEDASMKNGSVA